MCPTILCEVKVRGPEAEHNHKKSCNLERVGRDLEGFEQNQTTLPSHGRWTNGDCSYYEQADADEAADTLSPGKSHARVLN